MVWNLKRVLDAETGSSVLGLMKGYMLDEVPTDGGTTTRLWDANAIEQLDDLTACGSTARRPSWRCPSTSFTIPA